MQDATIKNCRQFSKLDVIYAIENETWIRYLVQYGLDGLEFDSG